ncbi:tyrosine-protein phosphatase [Arthrobacter flavus]|uniref:Tyrosine-protein phosphatase n=1 Tax=Arthrobacter flavus TaxID=95172 RepID=A0ABW4Q5J8_9MICC
MTSLPDQANDPANPGLVGWDGAVNARDLGGLGGLIQPGRIYRMGRHEWMTADGWQQAHDDGVRTVVDLRNPGEYGRRESDPAVADEALGRFLIVNRPTEDQSDAEFMELVGPYLSSPEYYLENLRRWPEKVVAVVRAVIDAPDGGVVVHCSAGRDRTGLVMTVMLSAAGVPTDEIVQDYARGVRGINEFHLTQETPRETPLSETELVERLDRLVAHLRELLQVFDAERYLLEAGLTAAELTALRSRLTG